MDYQSHVYSNLPLPPATYLTEYPNYSNLLPALYMFDLSLGYNTGDRPANDYMKHIDVYFTVNNIMNRNPPFQYGGTTNAYAYLGGAVSGANIPPNYNPYGRYWRLGVTKEW